MIKSTTGKTSSNTNYYPVYFSEVQLITKSRIILTPIGITFFVSSPYYPLACSSVFQLLMTTQTGFSIGAQQLSGLDY